MPPLKTKADLLLLMAPVHGVMQGPIIEFNGHAHIERVAQCLVSRHSNLRPAWSARGDSRYLQGCIAVHRIDKPVRPCRTSGCIAETDCVGQVGGKDSVIAGPNAAGVGHGIAVGVVEYIS